MNWFNKHLNWTLILSVVALQIIGYPLLWYLGNNTPNWVFWLTFSIFVIIYYGVYDYTLSRKGRKDPNSIMGFGWFLLWLTGWVGVIILLLAKNKSQVTE